ncbi:Ribosomal protein lysine methyltransferase [Fusarium falciforme]|nr:Ribosomal protein lysine methyltransferase [Fusarium falciforme]
MGSLAALIDQLEPEVEDPEEETFLLYSQPIPSLDLGFIDPRAASVDVSVAGHDFTIHQSPAVLSSSRAGGTTGAARLRYLPLSALALAPRVARYVLTDQSYVQRLLQRNIDENLGVRSGLLRHVYANWEPSINFTTLDWETDEVTPSLTGSGEVRSFDAVVACDCVYNYALVSPFVQTCVDACRLRSVDDAFTGDDSRPCICVIGQQLRNDEVFESWLETFHASFRVWRVPDDALPEDLRSSAGFVVHIGVLREEMR